MKVNSIETYKLSAGNGLITWESPDGNSYELDPGVARPGEWLFTNDTSGKPVMGLLKDSGTDGTLLVSLEGANSLAATLLHEEDDFPRKYYFSTDQGNNNELNRWAFILRASGVEGSPIRSWGKFRVLCVD